MKNKTILLLLLFLLGENFDPLQAMPPKIVGERKIAEEQKNQQLREGAQEKEGRISAAAADDISSSADRGDVVEAKENSESKMEDLLDQIPLEQRLKEVSQEVRTLG